MRWSEEITLIKLTGGGTNENGFPTKPGETATTVFCNKKSVGYSEFYKARQAGYNTVMKVDVHAEEYVEQEQAEYCGKRYEILRTYTDKSGELTELTLSDLSERGRG